MTTQHRTTRWIPVADAFDARLAAIRHEMRWNIKEAALACGLPQGSWREWELCGRRPRDYERVCKQIAQQTGCDRDWLMRGDSDDDQRHAPPPGQQPGTAVGDNQFLWQHERRGEPSKPVGLPDQIAA